MKTIRCSGVFARIAGSPVDTRIQGYKSDNYFFEFTIVIILK